jgi:hypothetical protein
MKNVLQFMKRFGLAIVVLFITGASVVIWWIYKGFRKK